MNKFKLNLYLREVKMLCDMALQAASDISSPVVQSDLNRFWNAVQSFLSDVANISKLFWPDYFGNLEAKQGRAAELKELLEIEDFSVLKSRSFRNHFEHSDERLDSFIEDGFIDHNIAPPGYIVVNGTPAEEHSNLFRHFDNTKLVIIFRQDSYDMKMIVEELKTVRAKVKMLLE